MFLAGIGRTHTNTTCSSLACHRRCRCAAPPRRSGPPARTMAVQNRQCSCCLGGAGCRAARGRRRDRPLPATRRRCVRRRHRGHTLPVACRAVGMTVTAARRAGSRRVPTGGGPGRGLRRVCRRPSRRHRISAKRSLPASPSIPWMAWAPQGCMGPRPPRRGGSRRCRHRHVPLAQPAACRPCLPLGFPPGRRGRLWALKWVAARLAACPRLNWVAPAADRGTRCTVSVRCMAAAGRCRWGLGWPPPPLSRSRWTSLLRRWWRPRRPRPGGTSGGT